MRVRYAVTLLSALIFAACGGDPKPAKSPPAAKLPSTNSPFVAEAVNGLGDPEIVIHNDSDVVMVLTLQGDAPATLEVPPRTTKAARVKPGTYVFSASATNVTPAQGEESFEADHRYQWTFTVVTKTVDDPSFAGKGWQCFDVPGQPVFWICLRTAESCAKAREASMKPGEPPSGPCMQKPVMHRFTETTKGVGLYAPTHEECEALRAGYLKEVPDAKLSPCEEKN